MPPQLIEREALLARLQDARREGGRILLVGGEAGVGKTALVRAFTAAVEGRVLLGACERLVTPAPLGPIVDVAGQVGGALVADIEAGRHPRQVALSLLEELHRPAVLVLEDVHWADEATLDVLRVLGRRVGPRSPRPASGSARREASSTTPATTSEPCSPRPRAPARGSRPEPR